MFNRIKIPWTIRDLFLAIALRLIVLYVLVRLIYPSFYLSGQSSIIVELTDRVLMVAIVFTIVFLRYPGGSWEQIGWKRISLFKSLVWGIGGGIVLWFVSSLVDWLSVQFLFAEGDLSSAVEAVKQINSWPMLFSILFVTGGVTPLAEELFYRGLIFQVLRNRWGLGLGVVLSSLIFGLFHFSSAWQMVLPIGGGIVLALLFQYSNSLSACIIAHLILNSGKLMIAFLTR